jgi:hypothetical protein
LLNLLEDDARDCSALHLTAHRQITHALVGYRGGTQLARTALALPQGISQAQQLFQIVDRRFYHNTPLFS